MLLAAMSVRRHQVRPAKFPTRAAVVAVTQVMRDVAEADLDPFAKDDLVGLLDGLDEAARLVDACRARVLGAVDRTEAWRAQGRDGSMAAWRARTTRAGQGKAYREINTARTLSTTPGAAEALIAGDMTSEQAEAVTRVATSGGAERRAKIADALADPDASGELLSAAKHLDAPQFARAAQAWAAALDPMTLETDHATQKRARFLSVADTPGGTLIKGRVDKMAGHRLRLALEAVTPVPTADDTRDHGQRAADALDVLAHGALADPASRPGGHVPPHVSIIMSEQTLAGLRALGASATGHEGAADVARAAPEAQPGQPGQPVPPGPRPSTTQIAPATQCVPTSQFAPATLEDGTPLPVSETLRILCDAQITRIVLDAESVPIDLGRTKRLWTGAQRRLVIARDRHCAFVGCLIPARWCEIHHIDWWGRDHGTTDLDNAVLLCSHHHVTVHAQNLVIRREAAPPGPAGAGLPLATYVINDRSGRSWSSPPATPPRPATPERLRLATSEPPRLGTLEPDLPDMDERALPPSGPSREAIP